MNCPKCGKLLHPDERIVCTQCGTPVPRSFEETPALFPERLTIARWPFVTAIIVLLVIFVIGPGLMGFRARQAYFATMDQIAGSGLTAKVLAYHQGWFSSEANIALGTPQTQITLAANINHGPYPVWAGWFSIMPVAAVVDVEPGSRPGAAVSMLPADLRLRTIIYFSGRSRTHVTMPPRDIAAPIGSARFLGLEGEVAPLGNRVRVSIRSPGIIGNGIVGWSVSDFAFNGDWRRPDAGVWIGSSRTTIREINVSMPGGRGVNLELIDRDGTATLDNGLLKFRGILRISSAVLGGERVGNIAWTWELKKIDPVALEAWKKRAQTFQGMKLDKQALKAAAQAGLAEFVIALAAKGPQLKEDFTMAASDGTVTAQLNVSVTPSAPGDAPEAAPEAVPMNIVKQRLFAKATVQAPCSLVDRMAGADRVNGWIQQRTLVKDGSRYLLKADFAGGKLMVNGKEVLDVNKLPPPPKAPPGAGGRALKST